MTQTRWTIGVRSDLAVVRIDPEYADLDHPNGEIIGEVFYLVATNSRGDRRSFGRFDFEAEAEAAIPFAPSVCEWQQDRPEYGSVAYQQYGQADEIESERRLNEAQAMGFDTRYMVV
jgi:hypothetical protein